MIKEKGIILKGIGGFYYVKTQNELVECKPRGIFREKKITPLAGDNVLVEYDMSNKGVITDVLPRKNVLSRPPVCNVDVICIVVSTVFPKPNLINIDKLTTIAVNQNIKPIIIFSKIDLKSCADVRKIYDDAGFITFETSLDDFKSINFLKDELHGKIAVFTGNSGVGKSTLINKLLPDAGLKTGEVSLKLSRGKHTTRESELFETADGGYIIDTPGFSSIDLQGENIINKTELEYCFPEFEKYLGKCKFPDCSHVGEKDCSIKQAVSQGSISNSRYQSYCEFYLEADKIKSWEQKGRK